MSRGSSPFLADLACAFENKSSRRIASRWFLVMKHWIFGYQSTVWNISFEWIWDFQKFKLMLFFFLLIYINFVSLSQLLVMKLFLYYAWCFSQLRKLYRWVNDLIEIQSTKPLNVIKSRNKIIEAQQSDKQLCCRNKS